MDVRKDTPTESDRLAALYRYHVLDTPPEKEFDQITRIATISLQMPIALISFVDKDRQWFKSTQGTDVKQTPVDVSFCAQAIKKDGPTIIEDLQRDYLFAKNPFVIDAPHIRFYAGVPLVTSDGFSLGTVCVLDRQPRKLTLDQMLILSDLAGLTMDKLELRRLKNPTE
jgi:GAF domain-containing protein